MTLYLLRSIQNNELLINSNGTLKVYNDLLIASADAQIFIANIIILDYNILLEFKIQQIINDCIVNNITVTLNSILMQSVFSPGETLIGKEKQIRNYIEKRSLINK